MQFEVILNECRNVSKNEEQAVSSDNYVKVDVDFEEEVDPELEVAEVQPQPEGGDGDGVKETTATGSLRFDAH